MRKTADHFIALLQPHYNSAAQYCRAMYTNRKDAEDGLQDAIIDALQHFVTLKNESKFRSWFFTILTRTFYRYLRKQTRIGQLFTPLLEQHQAVFPEVYTDEIEEQEKLLLMALNTLNEKERTAILLFEIGNLSLEEIKKVQQEKSLSTIKSRLSRTRLKLRHTIIEMKKNELNQGGTYVIKTNPSRNSS